MIGTPGARIERLGQGCNAISYVFVIGVSHTASLPGMASLHSRRSREHNLGSLYLNRTPNFLSLIITRDAPPACAAPMLLDPSHLLFVAENCSVSTAGEHRARLYNDTESDTEGDLASHRRDVHPHAGEKARCHSMNLCCGVLIVDQINNTAPSRRNPLPTLTPVGKRVTAGWPGSPSHARGLRGRRKRARHVYADMIAFASSFDAFVKFLPCT